MEKNEPPKQQEMHCSKGTAVLDKVAGGLDKICGLSKYLNAIALVIFFGMICVVFVDVFLRYFFNNALSGTKDILEVMLVFLVAFTVAHVYNIKGHIVVDLVINKLDEKKREVMNFITTGIMFIFLCVLMKQLISQAVMYYTSGKTNGVVAVMPSWPFQAALALGYLFMLIMVARDLLQMISHHIKLGTKAVTWLVMALVPVLVWVFFAFWMQPDLWSLSKPMLGLVGLIIMFALMFSGIPTGFAMMIAGFVMVSHIRGFATGMYTMGNQMFATTCNYTWTVVAFFTLMGMFCFHLKFGEDIFYCVQKFLGHVKGGLAVVTIGASALLGAVVGDNNSVVSTMSAIAYPQMKKHGYDDRLSSGVIAAGSSLGPLIPPSTGFIIFGSLTGVSVGKLFMAGIVPGIILALAFIAMIMWQCHRHPTWGPSGPRSTWGERVRSLPKALPILILFVFVIGGIFKGIFSATEGGAMGCVGAIIIGLVMRRTKIRTILDSLTQGGAVLGMIFTVLMGANVLGTFISWCNLSGIISDFFNGLNLNPMVFCAIVFILMLIAGCFIEIIPLFFLCIPIFYPIAASYGSIHPVWFGVMMTVCIQTGVITPPFASVLFLMRGLTKIPISVIFKGIWPYVLTTIAVLVLLFAFPVLVTWLPDLLYSF